MGHWIMDGSAKYFVEDGRVFSQEGGVELDPQTYEPLKNPPPPPVVEKPKVEEKVVPAIPDPVETPRVGLMFGNPVQEMKPPAEVVNDHPVADTMPLEEPTPVLKDRHGKTVHSILCKTNGRGGRFCDNCPRCEELKADYIKRGKQWRKA